MFSKIIQIKLQSLVKRYFAKHPEVKLVVVADSVGKTSTKVAIATVLAQKFRVRLHEGNHNSELSAPLAILGVDYPDNIRSPGAWLNVFKASKARIEGPTDVDVIVQELGSDRIGQIARYSKYLKPDIGVVTAVAAEHMEFFKTIENVAREELAVANFSKQALINRDDIDGEFAKLITNANISTYGSSGASEYDFMIDDFDITSGFKGSLKLKDLDQPIKVNVHRIGEHSLHSVVAAGAVGAMLGMSPGEIAKGVEAITAVPGRMNLLEGIKDSLIIDDSYNSSPTALISSLRTLYQISAPQKIAVLGSMNELGETSPHEHEEIGRLCDPAELAWVVTVGDEANQYIAPAAKANGCQVKSFKSAIEAGSFVRTVVEKDAVVLFKGSQGNIYLEEAVKLNLRLASDESRLVRQSPGWMATKTKFFADIAQ